MRRIALFLVLVAAPALGVSTTTYCQPSEVPTYLPGVTHDGPAQLPIHCVFVGSMPSPNGTVTLAPGQNLNAAYASALCGETISIPAGTVLSSPFSFPSKGCDNAHWITIKTGTTVPSGRISPTSIKFAKLVINGDAAGIATWGDHIHFEGLEITVPANGKLVYFLADMKGANHVVFDRVYIHGISGQELIHGIQLGTSQYVAIIRSYCSEIHSLAFPGSGADAQCIAGGAGAIGDKISQAGPYLIYDNFLEASTENIIFGGGTADGPPNDIFVLNNYLYKPPTWNPADPSYGGIKYVVKNNFEFKNMNRALVQGNVMENNWGGFTQLGYNVLFTPKSQAGKSGSLCPLCTVTNVTLRYNLVSNGAGGIMVASGPNNLGGYSQGQHHTSIHDNVFDGLQYANCYACGFSLMELGSSYSTTNPPAASEVLSDILIQNNDFIAAGDLSTTQPSQLFAAGGPPAGNPTGSPQITNVGFTNNVAFTQKNGIYSTGGGATNNCVNTVTPTIDPKVVWPACFVGNSPMTGNLLIGTPNPKVQWPSGNTTVPNPAGVFANFNGGVGGDYHLTGTYKSGGANIDLVNSWTSGVKQ